MKNAAAFGAGLGLWLGSMSVAVAFGPSWVGLIPSTLGLALMFWALLGDADD